MATQLQLRRGTTSETGSFTGAVGEVTVDTTKDTLVVHDGSTAGGFEMAKADGSNIEKLTKSGATKIATTSSGVDVTGTATMDALTVGGTSPRSGYIADFQGAGGNAVNIQTGDEASDISLSVGSLSTPDKFVITAGGSVTATGNVGIGVSPDSKMHLYDGALHIQQTDGSDTWLGLGTNNDNYITTGAGGITVFRALATERMRIDSSGNVSIPNGDLTVNGKLTVDENSGGNTGISNCDLQITRDSSSNIGLRTLSNGEVIRFVHTATDVGSIDITTTATVYNTSSDYRLKEDVQPVSGATDRLKELKPVNFAWKADGSRVDGFLAHEAQEVVPESVTGTKDAMMTEEYEVTAAVYEDVTTPAVEAVLDEDGVVITEAVAETTESVLVSEAVMGTRSVPDYQGIDQSKLVPLLVATIQELEARITALEA